MEGPNVVPTVVDLAKRSSYSLRSHQSNTSRNRADEDVASNRSEASTRVEAAEAVGEENEPVIDPEFKLPKLRSLSIIILTNVMLQLSFFIIVSSSSEYAAYLGGTSTFSGLVIGIPTVFSGLALLPMMKWDQGVYHRPLHLACAASVLGNMLYGLAYRAHFLYLILISRIVLGVSFTFWMYCKRYCSDPRIVGIRRRTALAGWLVVGQGAGFSVGPFIGGLLYRVGFQNGVFNGYTSPGWIMAGAWLAFWVAVAVFFEDVPVTPPPEQVELTNMSSSSPHTQQQAADEHRMTLQRWGVVVCMCWYAMTCFFILGAWEANIPVYTAQAFSYSPFSAGNLIALGGITTFPFLLANLFVARRVQDRHTLAVGSAIGLAGLLVMIALLKTNTVQFGTVYFCWFLVALGFNIASTCTLSLLSKQLPGEWNSRISLAIQYSNYTGRVTGAVWGGAGVKVGMLNYLGLQIAVVGIGGVMFMTLWRDLKAKTG
ncbi:MFS general substrate transporter [Gloeophyllum trabeum ATCC 11539]|uniref:MFS general substrate transporter n=1 Tax=Gloeophyllum trabeum (strain ATCC 11539 / FP-39264 / Madison 617) TaxID=670483 RepID=S7PYG1_GLOTA|nr:MFS general substrate transporter [Gloeophyllum trabeum ATCC 11539]EPQ52387.1 MFS general substrate transporter [Gloeophyllum trabeum ATCC 11539]